MKTFELKGTLRSELGKKATKALRREKMIPCEIYGGEGNMHFAVKASEVRKLIYTPDIFLVNLTIEGKTMTAVIKDMQFHPVADSCLHIDFLEVFENKPVVMEVPVKLEGLAAGVRAGGKLQLTMRKLRVKALYNNVPERLTVDVTALELGKTTQVKSLSYENLEILNAPNAVVCAVKLTRAARGAQATGAAQ